MCKEEAVKNYTIEDMKNINVRYYLLKIAGKSYVIDYADPKNLKYYFATMFLKEQQEYVIYDVTGIEHEYEIKKKPWYQQDKYAWALLLVFIFYVMNIRWFPKTLSLQNMTKDPRILEYWPVTILVMLGITFLLCLKLYFHKTDIVLPPKSYRLVRNYTVTKKQQIWGYLLLPILFIVGWGFGILGSNYADLVMFGLYITYLFLFLKFASHPSTAETYQIIENDLGASQQ